MPYDDTNHHDNTGSRFEEIVRELYEGTGAPEEPATPPSEEAPEEQETE